MNDLAKLLLPLMTVAAILIVMLSISELTGKKHSNTTINQRYKMNLPGNCAEVFKKRVGIRNYYSVVCYDSGLFLEPVVHNADSSYIARVQAVKDSLRNEFEGW